MSHEDILVVEDDDDILELIAYTLTRDGLRVRRAETGEDALRLAECEPIDLVLLDLMLPGIDGLEVCKRLRRNARTRGIPIIMVTAKGEESDVVTGLELGADDYVTKPFKPKELVARVRAVLRRRAQEPTAAENDSISVHGVEIHHGRREVKCRGRRVTLTYTEYEVLRLLALRPGWVFTRSQIVDAVRGGDYAVTERAVDVQIAGLRKKLGRAGALVETVRGVGYRFKDTGKEEPR